MCVCVSVCFLGHPQDVFLFGRVPFKTSKHGVPQQTHVSARSFAVHRSGGLQERKGRKSTANLGPFAQLKMREEANIIGSLLAARPHTRHRQHQRRRAARIYYFSELEGRGVRRRRLWSSSTAQSCPAVFSVHQGSEGFLEWGVSCFRGVRTTNELCRDKDPWTLETHWPRKGLAARSGQSIISP